MMERTKEKKTSKKTSFLNPGVAGFQYNTKEKNLVGCD